MTINIPSKSNKQLSQLKDALRILAWQQYKLDYQVKGLEAYESFAEEWKNHDVQNMEMKDFQKLIKALEYTTADLLAIRSEYYKKRQEITGEITPPASDDNPPF